MTGGKWINKNPRGHAKINGIFGRKKLGRVFFEMFFRLGYIIDKINYFHNCIDSKGTTNCIL